MNTSNLDMKVKFLKGLADKTRLQILETLRHKEMVVSDIVQALEGNQSNISQHLACLKECGFIQSRQEGKYVYYSLKAEHISELLVTIDRVLEQVEQQVATCTYHAIRTSN